MSQNQKSSRQEFIFVAIAIAALLAGFTANWIFSKNKTSRPELATATALYEQARSLTPFTLQDDNGRDFTKTDLAGRWTFMFFGYTHCPDICPTTLATLNDAMKVIKQKGDDDNTQVAFVSVDPERDTAETLNKYVTFFNPEFIGLTGTQDSISKFATSMGVARMKVANPENPENYLMDHSSSIALIGPKGKMEAVFSAPHQAKTVAEDFHKLRRYYEKN